MFGANKPPGSLFGNVNTSTPTSTSTPAGNGFLASKPSAPTGNSFGLNTVSTPSPGNPSGLMINKQSQAGLNLFGNNNSATTGTPQTNTLFQNNGQLNNTSTPGNSLFGANKPSQQQGGGLFGNTNNQLPSFNPNTTNSNSTNLSSGLFGNNNNNSSQPAGGLFGNKTNSAGVGSSGLFGSTTSQQPSLFSNNSSTTNTNAPSTSLFGNSSNQGPSSTGGGLFGNKSSTAPFLFGNNQSQQQQQQQQPNTNNPYGLQLNSEPILSMPESITVSLTSENHSSSKEKKLAESSISSINANSSNITSNSTLISKLSSRLKNLKSRETNNGLFSPSGKMMIKQDGVTPIDREEMHEANNKNNGQQVSMNFAFTKDVTAIKKLTIDSHRSAAKKMKLLNGEYSATKIKSLGKKESQVIKEPPETFVASPNKKDTEQDYRRDLSWEKTDHKFESEGYWCSPSVEQLKELSKMELQNVSNFVVGRKNYGSISFDFDVDLSDFADNFAELLFGKTIIFNENKTVEVYPEENNKPQIGYGLNVPATITLENVYAIDKKTKQPIKDNSKLTEIQLFVKRLRNMKEMEFISYNPFGGIWTFRVKHFSVWGIVNQEDIEVDEEDAVKFKSDEIKNRTFAYPRNIRSTKNEIVPGMFNEVSEIPQEADTTTEEALAMENEVFGLAPLLSDDNNMSLIVKEKPYEPSDVDEEDLEVMEVHPHLETSKNWLQQLQLAGTSRNSIFKSPSLLRKTSSYSLDDVLFSKFRHDLDINKQITKERKITSLVNFGKFSKNGQLILRNKRCASGCKQYPIKNAIQVNKPTFDLVFSDYLNTSVIKIRENAYPIVKQCSLNFHDIAAAYSDVPNEDKILKLASILFDSIHLDYKIESSKVKFALIKKMRYDKLCTWVVNETSAEINSFLENACGLERVYLFLARNDIINATKAAIASKNKHLSVLISLLGSNDPGVCELASLQISKWKSLGTKIDPRIISIYQLLTGNPFDSKFILNDNRFSWLTNFGIQLYYGDIDSLSLEELILHCLTNPYVNISSPIENITMNIMKLYACPSIPVESLLDDLRSDEKAFDIRLCWFFINMLDRSDITNDLRDRITLQFIEQLKSDNMHKESLFVSCFLINNEIAKKFIDLILSSDILYFTSSSNKGILERLQISKTIVHRHLALFDKYNNDNLSEVKNLLSAGDFKDAEIAVITNVAPELIISGSSNKDNLKLLKQLLDKFPSQSIATWNKGLGVYEKYLQLVLYQDIDESAIHLLIKLLPNMCKEYSTYELVNVACSIMSEKVAELFLIISKSAISRISKDSLLSLPLGNAELNYFEKVISSM